MPGPKNAFRFLTFIIKKSKNVHWYYNDVLLALLTDRQFLSRYFSQGSDKISHWISGPDKHLMSYHCNIKEKCLKMPFFFFRLYSSDGHALIDLMMRPGNIIDQSEASIVTMDQSQERSPRRWVRGCCVAIPLRRARGRMWCLTRWSLFTRWALSYYLSLIISHVTSWQKVHSWWSKIQNLSFKCINAFDRLWLHPIKHFKHQTDLIW